MTLANIVPAASAFTVMVNSAARSVSSVAISGIAVRLTLASPVMNGDVVTVAYTKPATNPLQTSAGGQAATITAQPVINYCENIPDVPNILPVIQLISPRKNSYFFSPANILIEAAATDSDGYIMNVEFYNGSKKIGESKSEPYKFVWQNVQNGRYTFTAIATDNSNAPVVSNTIHVIVRNNFRWPRITFQEPEEGQPIVVPATIDLELESYDPDEVISKVEYFNGSAKIGESSKAPYSLSFSTVDPGTLNISAVAIDSFNTVVSEDSTRIELVLNDGISGNEEILTDSDPASFNLFPNPNDGRFIIELGKDFQNIPAQVTVINATGEIVYSGMIPEGQSTLEINLPEIVPGTYILLISGNTIKITKKFIIR
jgi:hypothetical protein